ncbi:unnamed protein product, partial [Prunus brigantina]
YFIFCSCCFNGFISTVLVQSASAAHNTALMRPGRMDVHIHMSYCTPHAFKVLASNYLGVQDLDRHPVYGEIAGLLESTEVAPAEVCEELLKRDDDVDDDDVDAALQGVVKFLKLKKLEGDNNNIYKPEFQEGKRQDMDVNVNDDDSESLST